MKKLVFLFFLFISLGSFAQEEIPFTLADRDRLIRLEAEQKVIRNEMNAKFEGIDKKFSSKFESQQQQINDLKQFFFWGFGIVIALIIALFGYIIWDRRTAIYPLLNRVNSLENNQDEFGRKLVEVDRIKSALKEMGESDAKIAEILKRVAIF
jgi:hypothetical protein